MLYVLSLHLPPAPAGAAPSALVGMAVVFDAEAVRVFGAAAVVAAGLAAVVVAGFAGAAAVAGFAVVAAAGFAAAGAVAGFAAGLAAGVAGFAGQVIVLPVESLQTVVAAKAAPEVAIATIATAAILVLNRFTLAIPYCARGTKTRMDSASCADCARWVRFRAMTSVVVCPASSMAPASARPREDKARD